MIDLSPMSGVQVDPATRTVRVQGGATWGDCDRETQLFGLATPGGVVSTTGIARPDPARRRRASAPQVRSLDRQPALGRHRHRRRAAAARERDRERGPVLGGARRRQQLRRRHLVRVPAAPGRADGGVAGGLLPVGAWRDGAARLARLHGPAPDELSSPRSSGASRRTSRSRRSCTDADVVLLAAVYCRRRRRRASRSCSRSGSSREPLLDLSGPMPYAAYRAASTPSSPRAGSSTGSRSRSTS